MNQITNLSPFNVAAAQLLDENGFVQLQDTAQYWKDLHLSSSDLGAGASAPDRRAIAGGTVSTRAFNGTTVPEQLFGTIELDPSWKEGTPIKPHIIWAPVNGAAGNVRWNLTYLLLGLGTPPAETILSIVVPSGGTAWRFQRSLFPDITTVGATIGHQLAFRLWRDPTHALDTYTADAALLAVGVYILCDTLGSRSAGIK